MGRNNRKEEPMSIFGKHEKGWIEVPASRLMVGQTIRFSRTGAWARITKVKKLENGLYTITAGGKAFTDIKPRRKFDVRAGVR